MSVHYKFKSNLNYDTVTFDGLHISVADLKKSIMQQKKIGKSSDFDLQITNAQTKEVYDNEDTLVPKNTSVIIARVPVAASTKKNWDKPELPLPIDDDDLSGQIRFDKMVKNADIANTNATEDDKVKAMIHQSSQEYDPSKYVKSRSMTGPLPPTYTCYRCGKQGHWIKNCPTNHLDIKRSTGIPRSFMVPVDGPEHKGALLTSSGDYAVPIIDHQAYKEVKKEKPPFVKEPDQPAEPEAQIPEELLCMFCKGLLQDAVLIPCCGNSFCDECVRQALLDSDNHECPICHETDVSPHNVIPNRFLRTAVLNFKNEVGYTRVKKKFQPHTPPPVHIESPQPSPDSTVEPPYDMKEVKEELPDVEVKPEVPEISVKEEEIEEEEEEEEESEEDKKEELAETKSPEVKEEPPTDESPPGTPLADEPSDDPSDNDTAAPEHHRHNSYQYRYHRYRRDDYESNEDSEPNQISTISTICNTRTNRYMRPPPPPQRSHYQPGMHHRERQMDYDSRGRDYHGGYNDRRNYNERSHMRGQRSRRYERNQNDRYHHNENRRDYHDYSQERRHVRDSRYKNHAVLEHRDSPQYASSSSPVIVPAQNIEVTSAPHQYDVPLVSVASSNQSPALLPTPPQTYSSEPPPPGASPSDHSASYIPPQPPPPGVGPLLPPHDPLGTFSTTQSYTSEESQPKQEEKSLEDRLDEFQRKLDKKASESARDVSSRSSSRSRKRSRSSSRSSHSRSYTSSKSWSRTSSRSASRSSRSRSRTPYSRSSRSRSFSRSRSRSRLKARSYSRSRSRSPNSRIRSKSRSRSLDKKRRRSPRERIRIVHSRSRSRSPHARNFHTRNRQSPYSTRRPYNPPVQYGAGAYPPAYAALPPAIPAPLLRSAPYTSSHIHSSIPPPPAVVSHPVDHYSMDRTRYPYTDPSYLGYNVYPPHQTKPYAHQRYEREPRTQLYDVPEYQRDYSRRDDDMSSRSVSGWGNERGGKEYKPRYQRSTRDQSRKEIKELPKLPTPELKSEIRIRDKEDRKKSETYSKIKEEPIVKKKEKVTKHKKHHHRHSKERKKSEKIKSKSPVALGESTENMSSPIETQADRESESKEEAETVLSKSSTKIKEKKHKHKKHKTEEQSGKKKKVPKKEKLDGSDTAEPKIKVKKKKAKNKDLDENKKKEKSKHSKKIKIKEEPEDFESVNEDNCKVKVELSDEDKAEFNKDTNDFSPDDKVNLKYEDELNHEDKIEDPNILAITANEPELEENENLNDTEAEHDLLKLHTSNDSLDPEAEKLTEVSTSLDMFKQSPEVNPNEITSEFDINEESAVVEEETGEEMDYEDENLDDDEEEAEQQQHKDELHVDVPELSKWEIQEMEEDYISRPVRRSSVIVSRDDKNSGTLSSDIIQRAEKVILQKPLKTAIALTSSSTGKEKVKIEKKSSGKTVIPAESNSSKSIVENKSSDRSRSPNLQVTISTDKEKPRSVLAKDEAQKPSVPKKIRLDRSRFNPVETPELPHRTVIVEDLIPPVTKEPTEKRKLESRTSVTKREHIKIHGPDYKGDTANLSPQERSSKVVDKRYDSNITRSHRRSRSKEDSRWKTDAPIERRVVRNDPDNYRFQKDVRRTDYERAPRFYTEGHLNRPAFPSRDSHRHRSRSPSYESLENFRMSKQRVITERRPNYRDRNDEYRSVRSIRESSPIERKVYDKKVVSSKSSKSDKHKTYDESNFVPDYDDHSDSDPHFSTKSKNKSKQSAETEEKESRKRSSRVVETKRASKRKAESTSSDSSSSSASDSEDSSDNKDVKNKSSDTDYKRRKKLKHKKHKKHKHKKKRSHKSKLKD